MKEFKERNFKNAVISSFAKKLIEKKKQVRKEEVMRPVEEMGRTSFQNNPK